MDRQDELAEYIRRAHEITKPIIDEYVDPKSELQRKYGETENGREAMRKGWNKRNRSLREAAKDTSWEELQNIKQFYKNTPKGYVVDHIIPISRGGKHILSNLQYLTRQENGRKASRLPDDPILGW